MNDAPILGPASGTQAQAVAYLAPRAQGYTAQDVASIVAAYAKHGAAAGVDWFLALAQMAHETGALTSWWAQRERRNPCGFGVTGVTKLALRAPGPGWTRRGLRWAEGWSFPNWADTAIPAHLGRLLGYALADAAATDNQRGFIAYALGFRALPAAFRGSAPTICGLNGRWAVPGATYGQRIVALRDAMRRA